MNGLPSNTLRERGQGGIESYSPLRGALRSKAKKGYIGRAYHKVFIENGKTRHFVLFRNVRYLIISNLSR